MTRPEVPRPDPLTILAAPNAYKESLTALEACQAMECGARAAAPDAGIRTVPLADGGDGTIQALVDATDGKIIRVPARDPLGRGVEAPIGCLGDGITFVVEMAQASGLWMLTPEERNPLRTSTAGTGDCIRAALDRGARRLLIGIGGSATNEGGLGMARALGVRLLDANGDELDGTGQCLAQLARLDASRADPRLVDTEVIVMCDVDNPLTGQRGASSVYGPQKGATPDMVTDLDRGLRNLADVVERDLGCDILELPGSGAAGGLGGGLVAFAGGRLDGGFHTVSTIVGFEKVLRGADLVLTGEGQLDASTIHGKVPAGVARRAQEQGIPTVVIAGSLKPGWESLRKIGVRAAVSLVPGPVSLAEAMEGAADYLTQTAEQVVRLFVAGRVA